MIKDFSKWDKQRNSLEQEMHKKLHSSYTCIMQKCDRQLRELIKTEIKDREQQSTQQRKLYEQQIKLTTREIKDLKELLKSKDIDIKKVQNTLKYF